MANSEAHRGFGSSQHFWCGVAAFDLADGGKTSGQIAKIKIRRQMRAPITLASMKMPVDKGRNRQAVGGIQRQFGSHC